MARRIRDGGAAAEEAAFEAAVAARIAARRREVGLSQAAVATAPGISLQQFHKYERGSSCPPLGRLNRLAAVLGLSLAWLLGDEVTPAPMAVDAPFPAIPLADRPAAAALLRQLADALSATTTSPAAEPSPALPTDKAPNHAQPQVRRRRRRGAVWDPADVGLSALP